MPSLRLKALHQWAHLICFFYFYYPCGQHITISHREAKSLLFWRTTLVQKNICTAAHLKARTNHCLILFKITPMFFVNLNLFAIKLDNDPLLCWQLVPLPPSGPKKSVLSNLTGDYGECLVISMFAWSLRACCCASFCVEFKASLCLFTPQGSLSLL